MSRPLGEHVALQRGATYKSALLGRDGPVLLGLASIARDGGFRDDNLRTYGGDSPEKLLLGPGDLYVSLKDVTQSGDLLGAVARVPPQIARGRLTQDTVKLTPLPGAVPTSFLYWVLRAPQYRAYCRARAIGTTNLSLARDDFLSYGVPTPDAAHLWLSDVLDALESKIELNRRMNETLEAMARALFKSWFVDFDPVRAKMEGRAPFGMDADTAALFPAALVESPLGDIPRAWPLAKLREVTSVLRRGLGPSYIDGGGILVINQKCVRDHTVSFEKARRHDTSKRDVAGREVSVGDVLVNSTGVGTLGRVAQVRRLPEPAIVDSHVTIVRANEHVLSPTVLASELLRRESEIEELGEGSTGQTELSRERLGELSLVVPPLELQKRLGEKLDHLDRRLGHNEAESQTLSQLRDLLLPRLLSGTLRLRDAERAVEAAL